VEPRLYPDKGDSSYVPTFAAVGDGSIVAQVEEIPGFLRDEDVLKLYELAYFSDGPVLEIGTWCGKSTAALAAGARDSARGAAVFSVDINEDRLEQAREGLAARGLGTEVTLVRGSAAALFAAAPRFSPKLVFVDGDHTLRGVRRDLAVLERHVPNGALLLFHDYANTRETFEVRRALEGSWVMRECDAGGVFGLSGLFVRRSGGPAGDGTAPLVLDAVRYDAAVSRLKQRIPARLRERAFRLRRRR
jgi:SAM-dependent methyltransferase